MNTLWIHLPSAQRGTIFWEKDMEYGLFRSNGGVQFTVHKTEVITLLQLFGEFSKGTEGK